MFRLSSVERNNRRLRTFEKQYNNHRPTNLSFISSIVSRRSLLVLLCLFIFGYTTLELYNSLTLSIPSIDPSATSPTEFTVNKRVNTHRTTEELLTHCKYTKQGVNRVCDSNGVICSLHGLHPESSCCYSRDDSLSTPHSCRGCRSGCCGDYETCVSCCLRPDHLAQHASRTYMSHSLPAIPLASLEALSEDDFEWCELSCRTSSRALLFTENSYSSKRFKYCYSLDSRSPIDQAGVNSDRASACIQPQQSKTLDPDSTSGDTLTLCREGENYPIIKKPPAVARNVLRDYG